MSMGRALVLGGTGFIGRHLVRRLAMEGVETFVAVVASRGSADAVPDGCRVIEVPALDAAGLEHCWSTSLPDVAFNLAAAGVDPARRDPAELLDGNAGILSRLLSAASAAPPRLVIHAGSWSEYADPIPGSPLAEGHPLQPRSVYGSAKAAAEIYGTALAAELAIDLVTLRLFNVYGEGEAPHRLLPYLVHRLDRREPADLTEGRQARDFVHVTDTVEALVTAATNGAVAQHTAYNLCTGTGTAVRDFALQVARCMGAPSELLRFGALPSREDEPASIVGDPSRFESVTGWRPALPLAEGIGRSVHAIRAMPARGV